MEREVGGNTGDTVKLQPSTGVGEIADDTTERGVTTIEYDTPALERATATGFAPLFRRHTTSLERANNERHYLTALHWRAREHTYAMTGVLTVMPSETG